MSNGFAKQILLDSGICRLNQVEVHAVWKLHPQKQNTAGKGMPENIGLFFAVTSTFHDIRVDIE